MKMDNSENREMSTFNAIGSIADIWEWRIVSNQGEE